MTSALPEFSTGVTLYSWQEEALRRWEAAGHRGTLKVVTGAGKTVLGLAAIDQLLARDPELRVAIVVPTVVLQRQWHKELTDRAASPLVSSAVGLLGGGKSQHFDSSRRIVISVLNSASRHLAESVKKAGVGDHLLLIVDEVHRAGAKVMSRVFQTDRAYTLGLSATPERDEFDEAEPGDEPQEYEDTLLGREVGPIVYQLSLAEAIDQGVLPPFSINHYGVGLSPEERSKYESLSQSIKDAREQLEGLMAGRGRTTGLLPFAQSLARSDGRHAALAARFIAESQERKRILYRASARAAAVARILRKEFAASPQARALLFHESIDEVEALADLLDGSFPGRVAVEHSRLGDRQRERTIEKFRGGTIQILVSVRSLIEGFNVPAADIGVIVASSSSVRQRVQTLGRLLRRHRYGDSEEKHSVMHVIYARDTVDDAIYGQEDWEEATGHERNAFFHFLPPEEPEQQAGPPRRPVPTDNEVDATELQPGDAYPGRFEGSEYSIDTTGNVTTASGALIRAPGYLWEAVHSVKGQAGRFRVTPTQRFILVRRAGEDGGRTLFVTKLAEELAVIDTEEPSVGYRGPTDATGGEFAVRRSTAGIRVGQPLGQGRRGLRFLPPSRALDEVEAGIERLAAEGVNVGHFRVNERGHAIALAAGRWELLTDRGSELGL